MPALLFLFTIGTLNAQMPLKKGAFMFNAGLGFSGWGIPVNAGVNY